MNEKYKMSIKTIDMPDPKYQPTMAEKNKEINMPGVNEKVVRSAFFRPIKDKK